MHTNDWSRKQPLPADPVPLDCVCALWLLCGVEECTLKCHFLEY